MPQTDMPPMLVKAALVPFRDSDGKVEYRYRGAQVPSWCDPDDFNRYVRDGLIELANPDAYQAAPLDLPTNAGQPTFQTDAGQTHPDRSAR